MTWNVMLVRTCTIQNFTTGSTPMAAGVTLRDNLALLGKLRNSDYIKVREQVRNDRHTLYLSYIPFAAREGGGM